MPLPATWRSWLNWIGCSRATRAPVIHGDRFTSAKRPSRPAMKNTAPKMLTRAIVLALRWKICDIYRLRDAGRRRTLPGVTVSFRRRQIVFCEIFHVASNLTAMVELDGHDSGARSHVYA